MYIISVAKWYGEVYIIPYNGHCIIGPNVSRLFSNEICCQTDREIRTYYPTISCQKAKIVIEEFESIAVSQPGSSAGMWT